MRNPMLAPAGALIAWTLIMLIWMAATFGPAVRKVAPRLKPGARASELDGIIDEKIMWKTHNYEHLLEQPTIFYASVFILAWSGFTRTDVILAWIYVGLRIVHSLWQSTVNRQPVRAVLFIVSSAFLIPLGVRAFIAVI
jgi:hypothetical protein